MSSDISKKVDQGDIDRAKGMLPNAQLAQTQALMEEITATIDTLKGAKKLGVEKRTSILAKLVKAHADLVKTQRTMLGLDQSTGNITAGVIIIPGKSNNWTEDAKNEIENAKELIGKVQAIQDDTDPEPS